MSGVKDRSMATGPYPTSVKTVPVKIEGSWCGGGYRTRTVGRGFIITLTDGTEVGCPHPHGHKKQATLQACANRVALRLWDDAGVPRGAL